MVRRLNKVQEFRAKALQPSGITEGAQFNESVEFSSSDNILSTKSLQTTVSKQEQDLLNRRQLLESQLLDVQSNEVERFTRGLTPGTPQYTKARNTGLRSQRNSIEGIKSELSRVNLRLKGFRKSRERGTKPGDEIRVLKRKEAITEFSRLSPEGKALQEEQRRFKIAQKNIREANIKGKEPNLLDVALVQKQLKGSTRVEGNVISAERKNIALRQALREDAKRQSKETTLRDVVGRSSTAGELFENLGAPKRTLIGDITFGRSEEPRLVDKAKGFFTGDKPEATQEPTRRTRIFSTTITATNPTEARIAGLPGVGTFTILEEEREDFRKKTFIEKEAPKVNDFLIKSTDFLKEKDIQINELALSSPEFRIPLAISKIGSGVEKGATFLAEKSLEKNVRLAKQGLPNAAPGVPVFLFGVSDIGRRVKEKPITAGASEALLFGAGARASLTIGKGVARSKVLTNTLAKSKIISKVLTGTTRAVKTAEIGLGGAFVTKSIVDFNIADTAQEKGRILGGATVDIAGFTAGSGLARTAGIGISRGTKSASRSLRAAAINRQVKGKLLTPELAQTISKKSNQLSLDIRLDPLKKIRQEVVTTDRFGVQVGVGKQTPVFGKPVTVTSKELNRLPNTFIFDARVTKTTTVGVRSASKPGVTPIRTEVITRTGNLRGVTTDKSIQKNIDPLTRFDIRPTETPSVLKRQTRSTADIFFTPFDPPATSAVVPKPSAARSGKKASNQAFDRLEKKGGSIGFEPKLDLFESFSISNQGTTVFVSESFATGARTFSLQPFVVKKVSASSPKKQPTSSSSGRSTSGEIEIDLPQGDGTVLKKTIRFDTEQPTQETKQKQETKKETTQQTKQKTKKEQVLVSRQQVDLQSAAGRFQGLKTAQKRRSGSLRAVLSSSTGQKSFSKSISSQSVGQLVGPKQISAQVLKGAQVFQQGRTQQQGRLQQQQQSQLRQVTSTTFSKTKTKITRAVQERTKKIIIPKIPRLKLTENRSQGFVVEARVGGRFVSVIDTPVSREQALFKGADFVSRSAAATFRLKPSGTVVDDDRPSSVRLARLTSTLRQPVKGRSRSRGAFRSGVDTTQSVFVERSKFRIDTPEEVKAISLKGVAASRRKRRGRS